MIQSVLRTIVTSMCFALPAIDVAAQSEWRPTSQIIDVDSGDWLSLWIAVPSSTEADFGVRLMETALSEFLLGTLGDEVSTELEHSEHGLFFGFTGPAGRIVDVNSRFERWASTPEDDFVGDDLVLLRDRTLLRADDESRVLPGDRLRFRLGGRTPLSHEDLLELRSMDSTHVLGELRSALRRRGVQRIGVGRAGGLPFTVRTGSSFPLADASSIATGEENEEFPRLDAIYRQLAFDWAVEGARDRVVAELAHRALNLGGIEAFAPRGGETVGGFRPIERPAFSDRLLVGRRGRNSAPLSDLVAEVDRFLREFPRSPSFEAGFGPVRESVMFRLAPTGRSLKTRFGLHMRAQLLAESAILGIEPPAPGILGEIDREDVRAFLEARLSNPIARRSLIPQAR